MPAALLRCCHAALPFLLCGLFLFSSNAQAQQSFTHRLTGISYDYDNNGTPDATSTITYDGAGRATGVAYTYTEDGTPDILNTEDDDAASEVTVAGYNADNFLDDFQLDRTLMPSGMEADDTTYTFTGGVMTRFDSTATLNGATNSLYGDFAYISGLLSSVTVRNAGDDSIVIFQSYTNGANDLPSAVSILAGATTSVNLNWRSDGQLDDLSSATTFGPITAASGTADFTYAANGQIQNELWTATVGPGPHSAEITGETYRKTYTYDGQLLKTMEAFDLDDDGSIEATRTFTWTPGTCVPAFIFAPNGRANFAKMDGFPYTPGTGAEWLENCGPYLVGGAPPSVPGLLPPAWLVLVGAMILMGGFFSVRGIASDRTPLS